MDHNHLKIAISCMTDWNGTLVFDSPRYKDKMHFPFDYPRINQFPEWFTVSSEKQYKLTDYSNKSISVVNGLTLKEGIPLKINPGEKYYLTVNEIEKRL